MVFFYPGSVGITRLFSSIYCWDWIELLEVNLTKVWGLFSDWILPELSSQTCPHSVTTIHQLHFRFSFIGTGSHGGFSHGFLLQKVVTLWIHLPIQFGGSALCSECSSLRNLKKTFVWIFQFAQLWFIVRVVTSELLTCQMRNQKSRSLSFSGWVWCL